MMISVNPDFWHGKRVLLTGHTGFKGSWLSLWLQSMKASLYGLALTPPTAPNLYTVASVGKGMASLVGDIRDYHSVYDAFKMCKPEIVIHMAAQPLVRYSYQAPVETYATNVMGTIHVLEAARQVGTVRAIVNVTTDKCYENNERTRAFSENEPMGGYDPYSSSKGCSELITSAYRRSFFSGKGVALASARAGNVIGGGDWASDRLVPDILRAFERNQPAVIRNPHAVRPWQHVLEPLSGYLVLAEKLYAGGGDWAEGWNFGPNAEDARPVQWIVEHMISCWHDPAKWALDNETHPHEASYLKLNISKAKDRLGWHPRWTLSEALESIITWHRAWLNNKDMRAICLEQIRQYNT